MNEHILLDLDGTLWSPLLLSRTAWLEAGKALGLGTGHLDDRLLGSLMGGSLEQFTRGLFPDLTAGQMEQVGQEAMHQELLLIPRGLGELYPTVAETLPQLAERNHLYIVSNCQEGYIEGFLAHYHFEELITGFLSMGETGREKASNIAQLMRRYRIPGGIYVGDTQIDCDAAHANSLTAVYAAYGFGEVDGYDILLEQFSDLLAIR